MRALRITEAALLGGLYLEVPHPLGIVESVSPEDVVVELSREESESDEEVLDGSESSPFPSG